MYLADSDSWVLYGDGGEVRLREETTDVRPVHSLGNAQTPDRDNPQQRADGGVTELRRRERRLGWGCSRQQPPSDQVETQTKTGNRERHGDNDESALGQEEAESSKGSGIGTCMPLPNNDINQIKLG